MLLWRRDRTELNSSGGEIDRVMQMPGWTNVWTMPIQNRIDMLFTGVNTDIGIRVLGRRLEDVARASERIADVVKHVRGAADVQADPIRDKGYLDIRIDRDKALKHGVNAGDINELIETALGGKTVTTVVAGRERYPVSVRYPRAWRESEESVGNLLVPARGSATASGSRSALRHVPLSEVADIRIVEGPATIRSENGLLRNYVHLNVRGRGLVEFVDEARRIVAEQVTLPAGVYLEWTGQFEHELRARNTLLLILPLVIGCSCSWPFPGPWQAACSSNGYSAIPSRRRSGSATSPVLAWRPPRESSCWSTFARRSRRQAGWPTCRLSSCARRS